MAITPEVVEFDRGDLETVVAHFERLTELGVGWINLGPALSGEAFDSVPHKSGIAKWVSGRGPAVPMATWTPSARSGRTRAGQLGITHGTGPKALPRLHDLGIDLPQRWTKRQDHARNGIVIDLPDDVDHGELVGWLLRVMGALALVVETDEHWIAEVYTP